MLLSEAFELWRLNGDHAPKTVDQYIGVFRRLARMGVVLVEQVTVPAVAAYKDARLLVVSIETVNLDLSALCSVLEHLADREAFSRKALRRIRRLRIKVRRPEQLTAHFLTRKQVEQLVAAAQERGWHSVALAIRIATLAGLRLGELCRLRWSDVNLRTRQIKVVWLEDELGQDGRIKTRKERFISICQELMDVLVPLQPEDEIGYVLRSGAQARVKAYLSPRSLRYYLDKITKALEIEATANTLRHTRASWWIQGGAPIAKVASWLGHTVETCLLYYAGLLQGYDPDCEKAA